MSHASKKINEQQFVERCLTNLKKRQESTLDNVERSTDWYDLYCRTDEFIVPSKWVNRLEEANAIHAHFQYLHDKLDDELPKKINDLDREALYCSSALRTIRQNAFNRRVEEHQNRWDPITLIGELASTLPKPSTDPVEIEKQLYISLTNKK